MVTVLPKPQGDYGGKKTHFTVEKHLFSMTFVTVVPRSVTCCIYLYVQIPCKERLNFSAQIPICMCPAF